MGYEVLIFNSNCSRSREDSRRVQVFRVGSGVCSAEYSPEEGELLGIEPSALALKPH